MHYTFRVKLCNPGAFPVYITASKCPESQDIWCSSGCAIINAYTCVDTTSYKDTLHVLHLKYDRLKVTSQTANVYIVRGWHSLCHCSLTLLTVPKWFTSAMYYFNYRTFPYHQFLIVIDSKGSIFQM